MGTLNQNCREIAQNWMSEQSRPNTEILTVQKWMLGFVRQFRKDVKNSFPQREVNRFIPIVANQCVDLPGDITNIGLVGTQLGRYIKALSVNPHLATNDKRTSTMGMVSTELNNDTWYTGGLYNNINGLGAGWNFTGQMGTAAYGNNQDYGDYNIDWANGKIYTAQSFRYSNIVLKGLTSCIEDSEETCIEWEFVTSAEFYLDWRYDKAIRSGNEPLSKQRFDQEYGEMVYRRNRVKQQKIFKTLERIWGYVGH